MLEERLVAPLDVETSLDLPAWSFVGRGATGGPDFFGCARERVGTFGKKTKTKEGHATVFAFLGKKGFEEGVAGDWGTFLGGWS